MTISGVEPTERSTSFVTWGLAALGLTAAIATLPALKADKVAAQQTVRAETNAASASTAFDIRVVKLAPDKLKLKGLVATEEEHKALIGLVKASFPSADVTDRVKIAAATQTDIKLGGISFALKALSFLQSGSARIDEHGVALAGDTENGAAYTEFKNFVAVPPTGVVLKDDRVSQPPTSVSWRAEVGGGKVKLTGAVADTSDKKELEATVQNLFSGLEIVDETSVVAGASDSWLEAAMHSLQVLRLLDSGFVQLGDHKIQLYGQASDEAKLRKIDSLADNYPTGFALDTKVSAPARASMLSFPTFSVVERPALLDGAQKAQDLTVGATQ
jgi:hypothetical protein